jgi:hypothetical protein
MSSRLSNGKSRRHYQKRPKSFKLKQKSKGLLSSAKRAVEIAIEQDEQTALNWLSSNVQLPE